MTTTTIKTSSPIPQPHRHSLPVFNMIASTQSTPGPSSRLEDIVHLVQQNDDTRSLPSLRVCFNCGQTEGKPPLKKCAQCSTALYCSRECQTAHWKTHKEKCHKPKTKSDTDQQHPKTPMIGPWNKNLYKATTPQALKRWNLSPTVYLHSPIADFVLLFVNLHTYLGHSGNGRRAALDDPAHIRRSTKSCPFDHSSYALVAARLRRARSR